MYQRPSRTEQIAHERRVLETAERGSWLWHSARRKLEVLLAVQQSSAIGDEAGDPRGADGSKSDESL